MKAAPTINQAMILAAGLGTRMRPLTLETPKPLVKVGGKALIEYSLDALRVAKISQLIVNVHHLADQLELYLSKQRDFLIQISDERRQLLDSGGGIKRALPLWSGEYLMLLNADTFWLEEAHEARGNLPNMMEMFEPDKMDILLMLAPLSQTTGHEGKGDFTIDDNGQLNRYKGEKEPFVYAGVAIINRAIFDPIEEEIFSLNQCFDVAIKAGRLFGYKMNGHWITVGTMQAIEEAQAVMAEKRRQ